MSKAEFTEPKECKCIHLPVKDCDDGWGTCRYCGDALYNEDGEEI